MSRRNKPSQVTVHATGRTVAQAPAALRWWPRIIDGALSCALAAAGGVAVPAADPSADPVGVAILSWPLAVLLLGALYGRGLGIGQLLCGVISRRTRDGRFVGAWRGMCRYIGVALFPFWVWALISEASNPPSLWDDEVIVTRRS